MAGSATNLTLQRPGTELDDLGASKPEGSTERGARRHCGFLQATRQWVNGSTLPMNDPAFCEGQSTCCDQPQISMSSAVSAYYGFQTGDRDSGCCQTDGQSSVAVERTAAYFQESLWTGPGLECLYTIISMYEIQAFMPSRLAPCTRPLPSHPSAPPMPYRCRPAWHQSQIPLQGSSASPHHIPTSDRLTHVSKPNILRRNLLMQPSSKYDALLHQRGQHIRRRHALRQVDRRHAIRLVLRLGSQLLQPHLTHSLLHLKTRLPAPTSRVGRTGFPSCKTMRRRSLRTSPRRVRS